VFFFFQAEDGIRDRNVTGVQTCALPICCAYCLNMHGEEARKAGVDQQRIDVLAGWWEAPDLYTARERAALAFTEEVTNISEGGVSDETWQEVAAEFSEKETVELLMAIGAINVWNRMAITTHMKVTKTK